MVKELNHSIIMEALEDYRKDFKDDKDKMHEIDCALKCLESDLSVLDCFPVTYLSKDDIIHAFPDNPEVKEIVNNLDEIDMRDLAFRLGNDYCEQLFWESLRIIFESNYL